MIIVPIDMINTYAINVRRNLHVFNTHNERNPNGNQIKTLVGRSVTAIAAEINASHHEFECCLFILCLSFCNNKKSSFFFVNILLLILDDIGQ